jgi:3-deoxy-D-manno-octulosonate 8-phosphate phosphatase (KDO 8-P phosphatase)
VSSEVADIFRQAGGEFFTPPEQLANQLRAVKALLFDWDGVFTDGSKDATGHSSFSESDAMGVNLLRFAYWKLHGRLPLTIIITGEVNPTGQALAQREHFDLTLPLAKNKAAVFEEFRRRYSLAASEVLFCFDDVLDLAVAEQCGVRLMIRHPGSPLLRQYVQRQQQADYLTSSMGGSEGLREACELGIGLLGLYDEVVGERKNFTADYQRYFEQRNGINTAVGL